MPKREINSYSDLTPKQILINQPIILKKKSQIYR